MFRPGLYGYGTMQLPYLGIMILTDGYVIEG